MSDNPKAFPSGTTGQCEDGRTTYWDSMHAGMSLRDYFMAHAHMPDMQSDPDAEYAEAIVGRECPLSDNPIENAKFWAEYRAIMRGIEADAMLAEREWKGVE